MGNQSSKRQGAESLFLQCLSALAVSSVPAAGWVCLAGAVCGAGWRKSSATSHQCQAVAFCWIPAASGVWEWDFMGFAVMLVKEFCCLCVF